VKRGLTENTHASENCDLSNVHRKEKISSGKRREENVRIESGEKKNTNIQGQLGETVKGRAWSGRCATLSKWKDGGEAQIISLEHGGALEAAGVFLGLDTNSHSTLDEILAPTPAPSREKQLLRVRTFGENAATN